MAHTHTNIFILTFIWFKIPILKLKLKIMGFLLFFNNFLVSNLPIYLSKNCSQVVQKQEFQLFVFVVCFHPIASSSVRKSICIFFLYLRCTCLRFDWIINMLNCGYLKYLQYTCFDTHTINRIEENDQKQMAEESILKASNFSVLFKHCP